MTCHASMLRHVSSKELPPCLLVFAGCHPDSVVQLIHDPKSLVGLKAKKNCVYTKLVHRCTLLKN